MKGLIIMVSIGILVSACSRNPYALTNKSYKKQARAYAATISQYPLNDSVSNSRYWAGTTNFDMRRPNFVIIHHTAQRRKDIDSWPMATFGQLAI